MEVNDGKLNEKEYNKVIKKTEDSSEKLNAIDIQRKNKLSPILRIIIIVMIGLCFIAAIAGIVIVIKVSIKDDSKDKKIEQNKNDESGQNEEEKYQELEREQEDKYIEKEEEENIEEEKIKEEENIKEEEYIEEEKIKEEEYIEEEKIKEEEFIEEEKIKEEEEFKENGEKEVVIKLNENNYIITSMASDFSLPLNGVVQVTGKEFLEKSIVFPVGKSNRIFQINEDGQIEKVTENDLPLTFKFNDTLTNGANMFKDVTCFKEIDLSNMNTSEMTDASHMFDGCTAEVINFGTSTSPTRRNLQSGGLFVTYNIVSMSAMFKNANKLIKINIDAFDSSALIYTSSMFDGCSSLGNIQLPPTFTCEKVTEMSLMFHSTPSLKSLDMSYLSTTKLEVMDGMFSGTGLEEINLSNLNTNNVNSASDMFSDSSSIKKIDLPSKFNVGKNATNLFKGCSNLNDVNTSSIESTNIEEMDSMFEGCSSMTEIAFSNNFLTGEVKSLKGVFKGVHLETLDLTYLRLNNLQSTSNILEDAQISTSVKIGKYFTNDDNVRDEFLRQISIATEPSAQVTVPSDSDLGETFRTIYIQERNVNISITIEDADYEINFDKDKSYKLYTDYIHVGMGWDYTTEENRYDLDSSVLVFNSDLEYLTRVNYQHLTTYNGYINLNGDDVTGEGDGDDEEIMIHLNKLPSEATILTVQLNSYTRNSLKYVQSAYIRLTTKEEHQKKLNNQKYDSFGSYVINEAGDSIGLLIGCLTKTNDSSWYFTPVNRTISGQIVTESVSDVQEEIKKLFSKN